MHRKKKYFRADAGPSIGYGHFIRTLALADMLKDDFECTFFTQSPTAYQQEEVGRVCPIVALPSDETRFQVFLDYLRGDEIVVLDNYFYTSEYQKAIKDKGCKLVCIDDIHDKHFYADVVINHCIKNPQVYSVEKNTRLFMGEKWALLRKPFLDISNDIKSNSKHWVISFGGSDPQNLTLVYVKILCSMISDCQISLLLGDGYKYWDTVEPIENVKIYRRQTAEQVAGLFSSAEHVICSASSVCYEALACGCKVHAGYYVDNQVEFYHNLINNNLISPLGDLLHTQPNIDVEYEGSVKSDFNGIDERYRLLFNALSLDVVEYTEMNEEQSRQTWECRNREDIRKWMTDKSEFSFESHCSFVKGLNGNDKKIYYSFFDNGKFVGSYDFVDIKDGCSAERGLFVNPDCQGRKIAMMMETFMDGEIIKRGVKTLYAEVFKSNERSIKYHQKMGYDIYNEDNKYYYFKREI